MLRNILAVVAGYIVISIIVGIGLAIAYFILGSAGAYQEGSYEVTVTWIIAMITVGIIAALGSGFACAKISQNSKGAVLSLMGLIVVMSVIDYTIKENRPDLTAEQQVRTGEVSMSESPAVAVTPLWFAFVNPIIGVVGIMVGASFVCPCKGIFDEG